MAAMLIRRCMAPMNQNRMIRSCPVSVPYFSSGSRLSLLKNAVQIRPVISLIIHKEADRIRNSESRNLPPKISFRHGLLLDQRRGARYSKAGEKFYEKVKTATGGNWWNGVLGIGATGYALFKFAPAGIKFVIPALKVTKMAPILSMVVSGFAYSTIFGWKYGFGMVGLIFIHEMGHALMMRRLGVPCGTMMFIPFIGAGVLMKELPKRASDEVLIAMAGPVLGSAATLFPFIYGMSTGDQLGFALAHWGLLVNLFNLIPISPLDGGRVASAFGPKFLPVGLLSVCGGYILMHGGDVHSAIWHLPPLMYIILPIGAYSAYQRYMYPFADGRPLSYYSMPPGQKIFFAGSYFGLMAILLLLMQFNDKCRKSPERLRREMGY